MALIRERTAVELIRDRNVCLAQMHTRHGPRWYLIPGGEVSEQTAKRIRDMPQVAGSHDGLFPNINQTWRFT